MKFASSLALAAVLAGGAMPAMAAKKEAAPAARQQFSAATRQAVPRRGRSGAGRTEGTGYRRGQDRDRRA